MYHLNTETVNTLHTPHSNGTSISNKYNSTWIESPKQPYIVFGMRVTKGAHVLLGLDSVFNLNHQLSTEFRSFQLVVAIVFQSGAAADQDYELTFGYESDSDVCVGMPINPGCLGGGPIQVSILDVFPTWQVTFDLMTSPFVYR